MEKINPGMKKRKLSYEVPPPGPPSQLIRGATLPSARALGVVVLIILLCFIIGCVFVT